MFNLLRFNLGRFNVPTLVIYIGEDIFAYVFYNERDKKILIQQRILEQDNINYIELLDDMEIEKRFLDIFVNDKYRDVKIYELERELFLTYKQRDIKISWEVI